MNLEIKLVDVQFFGYHGIYDFERINGNEFIVNISVTIPWISRNDEIETTISYADIFEIVKEEMEKPKNLIETVASAIANRIISKWEQISDGWIEITKKNPPIEDFKGTAAVKLYFFDN